MCVYDSCRDGYAQESRFALKKGRWKTKVGFVLAPSQTLERTQVTQSERETALMICRALDTQFDS